MQKSTLMVIGFSLFAALACTEQKTQLAPSSRTPAAEAEVKVEHPRMQDNTENAKLDIELEHLPPPSELGQEYSTFVVWLTPQGSTTAQNVGELDYDPQSRKANLELVTPYEQFSLAITAEQEGNPVKKSDVLIASGDVDLRRYRH